MKMEFISAGTSCISYGDMREEAVPEIRMAQSIEKMQIILNRHLAGKYAHPVTVHSIRLVEQQRGQFYQLEYDISVGTGRHTLVGEIYPQYIPKNRYYITQQIYQQFKSYADGKFSIPKPVCIIPELKMALREKVKTSTVIPNLIKLHDKQLAKNISRMVNTLHQSDVMVARFQGHEYIRKTLQQLTTTARVYHPPLYNLINNIVKKTNKLVYNLPNHNLTLIHSSLTLEQISSRQDTLYLSGTEQCTMGDPCMDIGSLIADIQIQSFSENGDWNSSAKVERELLEEYLHLNPGYKCETLHCYNLLGLIQQAGKAIINSNNISLADAIFKQCEKRLTYYRSETYDEAMSRSLNSLY